MSASTQSSLVKQLGGYGGLRVTGTQTITGNFMAIHALDDCTIGAGTLGNIDNFSGASITLGDCVVGYWTTIEISGDAIVYHAK
mgnify:CR=1 FL=1